MTVLNRVRRQAPLAPAGSTRDDPRLPWATAGFAATTAIGLAHALVVAPRYHVGSFDDDANYVLAARALARGAGLTAGLAGGGAPLVGIYPPGFAALLAPIARLWPHGLEPLRLVPLACFAAVFPLTWRFLGRRRLPDPVRVAVLALLALNPVLATYATMVMPETAFVAVLLLLLLALDRWQEDARALTWAGAGTVAASAGLLYLKEAGAGLVAGVAAWLLLRRLWRKALVAAAGPGLLFLPVIAARASAGVALIGSRYSNDLGTYHGSAVGRITHLAPPAVGAYATNVFSLSIVGAVSGPLDVLQWTAAPLVLIGGIIWARRYRDGAAVAVAVYLAETLLYPFTNERRVVLVLPLVLTWYVLGGAVLLQVARHRSLRAVVAAAAAVVVLAAALPQFPRDYLYALGQDSSAPAGSPYMAILRQLGQPADVVETDYLWTTGLFSGHATANSAYQAACDAGAVDDALHRDRARYLLSAALNRPDMLPDPCLLATVAGQANAVRLYRSAAANASVFELVGPSSGHPGLRDLTANVTPTALAPLAMQPEAPQAPDDPAGTYAVADMPGGVATVTWSWGPDAGIAPAEHGAPAPAPAAATARPATAAPTLTPAQPVTQISLGAAAATSGTTSVVIEWQGPDGQWRRALAAPGPVGAGEATRYLLAVFPTPVLATAVRVTVHGAGRAAVHDLHVL